MIAVRHSSFVDAAVYLRGGEIPRRCCSANNKAPRLFFIAKTAAKEATKAKIDLMTTFFLSSFFRAGIGPRAELERHYIPVVADLPGVGRNLQDHIYPLGLNFIADASLKAKGETWTYIQEEVHTMPNILKYITVANGPIASIGALEGFGFIRSRFANYSYLDWPDFQIHFLSGCVSSGKFCDFGGFLL